MKTKKGHQSGLWEHWCGACRMQQEHPRISGGGAQSMRAVGSASTRHLENMGMDVKSRCCSLDIHLCGAVCYVGIIGASSSCARACRICLLRQLLFRELGRDFILRGDACSDKARLKKLFGPSTCCKIWLVFIDYGTMAWSKTQKACQKRGDNSKKKRENPKHDWCNSIFVNWSVDHPNWNMSGPSFSDCHSNTNSRF